VPAEQYLRRFSEHCIFKKKFLPPGMIQAGRIRYEKRFFQISFKKKTGALATARKLFSPRGSAILKAGIKSLCAKGASMGKRAGRSYII
jgi:hypothetical protein